MFSAKYCWSGLKLLSEFSQLVRLILRTSSSSWRKSSHLATKVSRALKPQDGRIPYPVDRNIYILNFPHWFFVHFLTILRKLWIKSDSGKKSRAHRTSKTGKSSQSYSDGNLPYHCLFYYLARALDAWRGVRIYVRSKDAQKQLARTSLRSFHWNRSYTETFLKLCQLIVYIIGT